MDRIIIRREDKISSIQNQFNHYFPFLKIEFFRQAPISGRGNASNKMIVDDVRIGHISGFRKEGEIEVRSTMLVSALENQFEKENGLYIQVFRKSGKVWLETTATDNWTLYQQNEEGKNLAQQLNIEREDTNDHDVY